MDTITEAIKQLGNDSDFHRKIIFSDEAHFWLNGFLNKQNMRYWPDSNSHVLHESSLYPEKNTVWFRDDQDQHVTVNGNRYRSMITEYFWPQFGWYGLGGHVVPTGRRHKPHSQCHN